MKIISVAIILLLGIGCTDRSAEPPAAEAPESPGEAIQAIIALYDRSDFDALIRTRYAEIGKAKDEAQVKALIDRFTSRFGSEDSRAEAIEMYRSVLQLQPALTEDGTVATYTIGERFIKLSRMPNGSWGFHL